MMVSKDKKGSALYIGQVQVPREPLLMPTIPEPKNRHGQRQVAKSDFCLNSCPVP